MQLLFWLKKLFKKKRTYGLIPQLKDSRDYKYKKTGTTYNNADAFDYEEPVNNQGRYNSCVAHSAGEVLQREIRKVTPNWYKPRLIISKAFIWVMCKYNEGTISQNSGVVARNAFKTINKYGLTQEKQYNFNNDVYKLPSKNVLELAYMQRMLFPYIPKYYSITKNNSTTINNIKNAISNDHLVSLAIPVYDSFEDYRGGLITAFSGDFKGYHDVVIGAYEETDEGLVFKGKNSWGTGWGEKGYFSISADLLKKHGFDIWTMS